MKHLDKLDKLNIKYSNLIKIRLNTYSNNFYIKD